MSEERSGMRLSLSGGNEVHVLNHTAASCSTCFAVSALFQIVEMNFVNLAHSEDCIVSTLSHAPRFSLTSSLHPGLGQGQCGTFQKGTQIL